MDQHSRPEAIARLRSAMRYSSLRPPLIKVLEIALHDGVDPRTGKQLGPHTGAADGFMTFEDLFDSFRKQLRQRGIQFHRQLRPQRPQGGIFFLV